MRFIREGRRTLPDAQWSELTDPMPLARAEQIAAGAQVADLEVVEHARERLEGQPRERPVRRDEHAPGSAERIEHLGAQLAAVGAGHGAVDDADGPGGQLGSLGGAQQARWGEVDQVRGPLADDVVPAVAGDLVSPSGQHCRGRGAVRGARVARA